MLSTQSSLQKLSPNDRTMFTLFLEDVRKLEILWNKNIVSRSDTLTKFIAKVSGRKTEYENIMIKMVRMNYPNITLSHNTNDMVVRRRTRTGSGRKIGYSDELFFAWPLLTSRTNIQFTWQYQHTSSEFVRMFFPSHNMNKTLTVDSRAAMQVKSMIETVAEVVESNRVTVAEMRVLASEANKETQVIQNMFTKLFEATDQKMASVNELLNRAEVRHIEDVNALDKIKKQIDSLEIDASFTQRCALLSRVKDPKNYELMFKAINKYDQANWSYESRSGIPLYVIEQAPEHMLALVNSKRLAITVRVMKLLGPLYDNMSSNNKIALSTATLTPALLSDLEGYPDEDVYLNVKVTEKVLPIQKVYQSVIANANNDITTLPVDPNMDITENTLHYDPLALTNDVWTDLYKKLPTRRYFNGRSISYSFETTDQIDSEDKFLQAIRRSLASIYAKDRNSLAQFNDYPSIYNVVLLYINNAAAEEGKISAREFVVFSSVGTYALPESAAALDLKQAHKDSNYEGNTTYGADYTLDMQQFIIRKISLQAGGAGGMEAIAEIERVYGMKFRPNNGNMRGMLGWAEIYHVNSMNNHCFMSNLARHLRRVNLMPKGSKYEVLAKYEESGLRRYEDESGVSIDRACQIAKWFGLNIVIYEVTSDIIAKENSSPKLTPYNTSNLSEEDRTLRLVYTYGHYFYLSKLTGEKFVKTVEVEEDKKIGSIYFDNVMVYFDLETVMIDKIAVPYSISYNIPNKNTEFSATSNPTAGVLDELIDSISRLSSGTNVNLTAYNGSNFDFLMLQRYLIMSQKGYIVSAANPSGKGQKIVFLVKCTSSVVEDGLKQRRLDMLLDQIEAIQGISDKRKSLLIKQAPIRVRKSMECGYVRVTTWDPVLIIRSSLDSAARNFKTSIPKGSLDHEEIQQAYDKGELSDWLSKHESELRVYNNADVDVLKEVCEKVIDAITTMSGLSRQAVLSKPSASAIAYSVFEGFMRNTKLKPTRVKTEKLDELIRKSVVAGRCEGDIGARGEMNQKYIMIDAVSLYPTVMLNNKYPVGTETLFESVFDTRKALLTGMTGLVYCEYDQSKMQGHAILPTRGDTLNWKELNSGVGYIPTPTYRLFQKYAVVKIVKPEEGPVGILWKSEFCFKEYVETFSSFKNEQDEYKMSGDDRYNQSIRELAKIFLNGLSGKMIQKNYTNDYVYVANEAEFEDVCISLSKEIDKEFVRQLIESDKVDYEDKTYYHYDNGEKVYHKDDEYWRYNDESKKWETVTVDEESEESSGESSGQVVDRSVYESVSGVELSDNQKISKITADRDMFRMLKEEYPDVLNKIIENKKINIVPIHADKAYITYKKSGWNVKSKPSHVGVMIYAYARAYMYENVFSKMHVIYTDTDSALIKIEDFDKVVRSRTFQKLVGDQVVQTRPKKFGDFEIEDVGILDDFIIIAPKTYGLIKNGEVVKYGCKGVNISRDTFLDKDGTEKKIKDNLFKFYEKLMTGNTRVTTTQFKKHWLSATVEYGKVVKEI